MINLPFKFGKARILFCSIFLVILSQTGILEAQTVFQKTYGGTSADRCYKVHHTSDGGFVMGGQSSSNFGSGQYDLYVVKTDSNGEISWTRTLGTAYNDYFGDIIPTSGGYMVLGTNNEDGNDLYLTKINSSGYVSWRKSYGNINVPDEGESIYRTSEGGYILAGKSGNGGSYGLTLIKINSTGDTTWTRIYDDSDEETGYAVIESMEGGYIVVGEQTPWGKSYTNLLIVKTDASGDTLWTRSLGGTGYERGYSVVQNEDSTYMIFGSSTSYGAGQTDMYLVKMDINGNIIWSKTYGSTANDVGMSIAHTNDDNYILAGFSSMGPGLRAAYMVKINPAGDTLWSRIYGGASESRGYSAKPTSDGGYVLGGYTSSFGSGSDDFYLIKTDKFGKVGCNMESASLTQVNTVVSQLNDPDLTIRINCDYRSKFDNSSTGGTETVVCIDTFLNADFGTSNFNVCQTNCVDFTDQSKGSNINSWLWTFEGASVATDTTQHPTSICYDTAGTYAVTLIVSNGPETDTLTDSIVVFPFSRDTIYPVVCDEYTVPSGNATYTASGTYFDTIPNQFGCDSFMVINAIVLNRTYNTVNPIVTSCDGNYTSPSGNYTWDSSGTYQDTITNAVGCDSVLTINLFIYGTSYSNLDVTTCSDYVSPSGNYTWVYSGTYQDTIPNYLGCDSVITISLTGRTKAVIDTQVCYNYVSPSGKTWNASNTYMDTIPNTSGCDSIITIDLVVNTFSRDTVSIVDCDNFTVPSGDETYTISGTYLDTILTAQGCDSFLVLNVTLNYSSLDTQFITSCEDSYIWEGNLYFTDNNTAYRVYTNSKGCDSVLKLNLTFADEAFTDLDTIIQQGETITVGTNTYDTSGTYKDTLVTSMGCDSIITTNLTVISGVAHNLSASDIKIWPVPARDLLHINGTPNGTVPIVIYDVMGRRMDCPVVKRSSNALTINTGSLQTGIYYLNLSGTSRKFTIE